MSSKTGPLYRFRHYLVLWVLLGGFGLLVVRAAELQLLEHEFLQSKGNVNYLTVQVSHANRGMILDRNGEPLAVSSPVDSVVADPKAILREGGFDAQQGWVELAKLIDEPLASVRDKVTQNPESEFAYLKRHLDPERARQVKSLGIPGITLRRDRSTP